MFGTPVFGVANRQTACRKSGTRPDRRMEVIMEVVKTILAVLLVLISIALVAIITLQSGKENGLSSALAGGTRENYLSKSGSKDKLAGLTKWVALAFVVVILALNIL